MFYRRKLHPLTKIFIFVFLLIFFFKLLPTFMIAFLNPEQTGNVLNFIEKFIPLGS